jgi:uncharacterized protein (TIGR02147 family)
MNRASDRNPDTIAESDFPNIYRYDDFRRYLEDYRVARKKTDPTFTHQHICGELGLPHTRGFFNNIVKGRRVLTDLNVERFIQLLELKNDEALYFRILVKHRQSDNRQEKDFYRDRLIALNKFPAKQLNMRESAYYGKWHNSVIRTLLGVIDFDGDFPALARKVFPRISAKAARDSVKLQLALGLLRKNERGLIKPTDAAIAAGPLVRHAIIRKYQLQCLDLARLALNKKGPGDHTMSTNVFGVSDECFAEVKRKAQKFKSEVRSLIQKDDMPPTRVYHLNLFLFPGTDESPETEYPRATRR